MPLSPEQKQQWLDALRSDKYKKGRVYLMARESRNAITDFDKPSNVTFCCLGVLGKAVLGWDNAVLLDSSIAAYSQFHRLMSQEATSKLIHFNDRVYRHEDKFSECTLLIDYIEKEM